MRKASVLALSLGLVWGGVSYAQDSQSSSATTKADQPRSLIEAVGFRKKCASSCDCAPATSCPDPSATAVAPAAPCPPGYEGQIPMAGIGNGIYGHGHAPAPAHDGRYSLFGRGIQLSGQFPSWAWRHKPAPPPPPPELYPGISWHRYPRSPRDFWMIEP